MGQVKAAPADVIFELASYDVQFAQARGLWPAVKAGQFGIYVFSVQGGLLPIGGNNVSGCP